MTSRVSARTSGRRRFNAASTSASSPTTFTMTTKSKPPASPRTSCAGRQSSSAAWRWSSRCGCLLPGEVDHALAHVDADRERRAERGELVAVSAADVEHASPRGHDEPQQPLEPVVVVTAARDPLLAVRTERVVERLHASPPGVDDVGVAPASSRARSSARLLGRDEKRRQAFPGCSSQNFRSPGRAR